MLQLTYTGQSLAKLWIKIMRNVVSLSFPLLRVISQEVDGPLWTKLFDKWRGEIGFVVVYLHSHGALKYWFVCVLYTCHRRFSLETLPLQGLFQFITNRSLWVPMKDSGIWGRKARRNRFLSQRRQVGSRFVIHQIQGRKGTGDSRLPIILQVSSTSNQPWAKVPK